MKNDFAETLEPLYFGASPLSRTFSKIRQAVQAVKVQSVQMPTAKAGSVPTVKIDQGKISVEVPSGMVKKPAAGAKKFPIIPVAIAGAAVVAVVLFKKKGKKAA